MKYTLGLVVLGVGQVYLGLRQSPLPAALLIWSGLSFLVVAAGYAGLGPRIFGKRPDGSLPLLNRLILFPYLCLSGALWHVKRATSSQPGWHEVAPGLRLGRLPLPGELPPEVTLVVDLTAEFSGVRALPNGCGYVCLPCLDATAPDGKLFQDLVERLANTEGDIYVHCALGHSRSATVVAAVLVARRIAPDATSAIAGLKRIRPGVGLGPAQQELLTSYCASLLLTQD